MLCAGFGFGISNVFLNNNVDYVINEVSFPGESLVGMKAGHKYKMSIQNRTLNNYNCPICAGNQLLVGYNDVTQSDSIMAEWDYENNVVQTFTRIDYEYGNVYQNTWKIRRNVIKNYIECGISYLGE